MLLLISVLMPLIGGTLLLGGKHWTYEKIKVHTQVVTIFTSMIVMCLLLSRPEEPFELFAFGENLKCMMKLDGLSCIFAGLMAFLWPFVNMYVFEYRKYDEERKHMFFAFFLMMYGTILSIALAGNLFTIYLFCGVLILVILVLHLINQKAIRGFEVNLVVANAGAFAMIRMIYYSYGTDVLSGTWAKHVGMALAMIAILYGSIMAVKEVHIERRLAYATVSNVSYIVLGAAFMTPAGMAGSLIHLVMYAFMNCCAFFCVGAIVHQTGKHYISELEGLGRKMPVVFGCLTIAAISLAGIPPFAGFISKWNLARAGLELEMPMGIVAVGVLLGSSLLTVMYMGQVVIRGWFPRKGVELPNNIDAKDPNGDMMLPLVVFTAIVILLGLYSEKMVDIIMDVAREIF